jgi:hypothetical protein
VGHTVFICRWTVYFILSVCLWCLFYQHSHLFYINDIRFILYLSTWVLGYKLHEVWIRSDRKMSVINRFAFAICVLFDSVWMFTPQWWRRKKGSSISPPTQEKGRHVSHCVHTIIFIVIVSTLSAEMINTQGLFHFHFHFHFSPRRTILDKRR